MEETVDCFLNIPIYRCSPDQYEKEMAVVLEKFVRDLEKGTKPYQRAVDYFNANRWYPWRYNQIIGWLSLHRLHTQIRAYCVMARGKRFTRTMRKYFVYIDQFLILDTATDIEKSETSDEIFDKILEGIRELKREKFLKRRFIDFEELRRQGILIDWKKALGINFPR